MDILYLVNNKSTSNFEDLRLSLRSLDMYGKDVSRVFICGFIPKFISDNVIKIPFDILPYDNLFDKGRNIYKQIIYAIEHSDIGICDNGEFLVSMDDHYITRPTFFNSSYPFYVKDYIKRECRHMLPEVLEEGFVSSDYQEFLIECCKYLKSKNLSTLNFTLHRNMHMNRHIINELSNINKEIFEDKKPVEAFCLINNYRLTKDSSLNYTICRDIKYDNPERLKNYIKNNVNFFSINDFKWGNEIHKLLLNLFPYKCKYEK